MDNIRIRHILNHSRIYLKLLLQFIARLLTFLSVIFLVYMVFFTRGDREYHSFYLFLQYVIDLLRLNLGTNDQGISVLFFIKRASLYSAGVFFPSLILAGVYAWVSLRREFLHPKRRFQKLQSIGIMITSSIPVYWIALFFFLVTVTTGWFPLGGTTSPNFQSLTPVGKILDFIYHLLLPWFSLSLFPAILLAEGLKRKVRELRETLFFRTARSQGYSRKEVFRKHLRPSLLSELFALLSGNMPLFFTYLVFVELVFQYTGLGYYLIMPYKNPWGSAVSGMQVSQAALTYVGIFSILFQFLFSLASKALIPAAGNNSPRNERNSYSGLLFLFPVLMVILILLNWIQLGESDWDIPLSIRIGVLVVSIAILLFLINRDDFRKGKSVREMIRQRVSVSPSASHPADQELKSPLSGASRTGDLSRKDIAVFLLPGILVGVLLISPWLIRAVPDISPLISVNPKAVPLGERLLYYCVQTLLAGRFLIIPLIATVIGVFIGVFLASLSGFLDLPVISSLVVALEMFPSVLLLVLLSGIFFYTIGGLFTTFVIFCTLKVYKLMLLWIQSFRNQEFMLYSETLGASLFIRFFRHILPLLKHEIRSLFFSGFIELIILETNFQYLGAIYQLDRGKFGPLLSSIIPVPGYGSLLLESQRLFIRGTYLPVLFPILFLILVIAGLRGINHFSDRFSLSVSGDSE